MGREGTKMWLRSLGISALLLFLQTSFPANTRRTFRERYGPPISENFLIRPGVVGSASYGASGHVCEVVVSPQRLWNSTLGSEKVTDDLIDEIVPVRERGKHVISGFVNAFCPTGDCFGSDETWEKVYIFRNGNAGNERYVQIHWRRDECGPANNG